MVAGVVCPCGLVVKHFHIRAVREDRLVALALRAPLQNGRNARLGGTAWPSRRPVGGQRGGQGGRRGSRRYQVPLRLRRDLERHSVHSA